MNADLRLPLRIANLIRARAVSEPAQRLAVLANEQRQLGSAMELYQSACRQAAKANSRRWYLAAGKLAERAAEALDDLRYEIDSWRNQRRQTPTMSSLGEIVRDLEQLESEFHEWQYDPATQDLSIKTDSIELEEVELGPFQIKLHLKNMGRPESAYSIVAVEPNHPSSREDVTHPHVQDEHLCAGDATGPIRAALEEGRICDFFLLVRSVLQTYNGRSAYVQLDDWHGTPCHDCGYNLSDDDSSTCQVCDHVFCESCSSYCRHCESSVCLDCLETCRHCDEKFCPECFVTCSECGKRCCADCVTEGLCPDCQKEMEKQSEPDAKDTNTGSVQPAAVPVGG